MKSIPGQCVGQHRLRVRVTQRSFRPLTNLPFPAIIRTPVRKRRNRKGGVKTPPRSLFPRDPFGKGKVNLSRSDSLFSLLACPERSRRAFFFSQPLQQLLEHPRRPRRPLTNLPSSEIIGTPLRYRRQWKRRGKCPASLALGGMAFSLDGLRNYFLASIVYNLG